MTMGLSRSRGGDDLLPVPLVDMADRVVGLLIRRMAFMCINFLAELLPWRGGLGRRRQQE